MSQIRIGFITSQKSVNRISDIESEIASKLIVKAGISAEERDILPVLSHENIINQLKRDEIDCGIIPVKLSEKGVIKSSYERLKSEHIEIVATEIVECRVPTKTIHHKKTKGELIEYRMYRKTRIDYSERNKPKISERILYGLACDAGFGYITKAIFIIAILATIVIGSVYNPDVFRLAVSIGSEASALFLLLTSKKVRYYARYRSITGYWKYFSYPSMEQNETVGGRHIIPRVVHITQRDGELYFKGWMCDKPTILWFHSKKTVVTNAWENTGKIVYWYENGDGVNRFSKLNGITVLEWDVEYPQGKINKMTGWYSGQASNEIGKIDYFRISKQEFDNLMKNDYLPYTEHSK